jgi:hypothetical protein
LLGRHLPTLEPFGAEKYPLGQHRQLFSSGPLWPDGYT